MIILRKKNLAMLCMVVIISVFTFFFTSSNINFENKTVQTSSLPVCNKVIVIDAGHGIPDERSPKQ